MIQFTLDSKNFGLEFSRFAFQYSLVRLSFKNF